MQTIGLIGGMSYESTITYYQQINKFINSKLRKMHSAKCIIYSVDFEQIAQCQREDNWEQASKILTEAAISLQKAGADFIVICTNTMHKVVPTIQANINLPILHIAKVTANTLIEHNITKVGLLGTKYTMQLDFYKDILKQKGIEVICPEIKDMDIVNKIIFDELCQGIIKDDSRQQYLHIIEKLQKQNAQAIILGCTEIGLLIQQKHCSCKIFDTTLLHAQAAAIKAIA